jgi:hypothetical protein
MILLGALMVAFGGGPRSFRFVAAPLGALVGFLLAPAVTQAFGLNLSPSGVSAVGAFALFLGGAVVPPSALFFAAGIPAALVAGRLAGNGDYLFGFIPGLLLVGTVAALATRPVGAVVTAASGGWLLLIGALATFHRSALVPELAAHAYVILAAAGLFTVVGSVYQLAFTVPPEQAAKEKAERLQAKRKAADKKALEERWSNYSEKR